MGVWACERVGGGVWVEVGERRRVVMRVQRGGWKVEGVEEMEEAWRTHRERVEKGRRGGDRERRRERRREAGREVEREVGEAGERSGGIPREAV